MYNSASTLATTALKVADAIQFAKIAEYEILIVDDGSHDNLKEVVRELKETHLLSIDVLAQRNLGRMSARLNGAQAAKFEDIVFIDSRVHMERSAIKSLDEFTNKNPSIFCVVANISYEDHLPYISYFWEALEHLAWHKFYNSEADIQLTLDNFNQFPKGTTMIFFRKQTFIKVSEKFQTLFEVGHDTNDDTHLLRLYLESYPIVIVRDFSAIYFPRKKIIPFLRHSFFRGKMASNGYFYPKSPARYIFILAILVFFGVLFITWNIQPSFVLLQLFITNLLVYILARIRRLSKRSIISLMLYEIPFSSMYLLGIMRSQFHPPFRTKK